MNNLFAALSIYFGIPIFVGYFTKPIWGLAAFIVISVGLAFAVIERDRTK